MAQARESVLVQQLEGARLRARLEGAALLLQQQVS